MEGYMKFKQNILPILLASVFALPAVSEACTRVICEAGEGRFLTARSMDWQTDLYSDLWIFPRGMKRDGGIDANSIKWTSKYGSVIASGFDAGTADGMNEKGLNVNLLYLVESDYGKSDKPTISVAAWPQYILDNFATVQEVVKGLSTEPFQIIAPPLPDGAPAGLHVSVSDANGDSAIFEHIDGKLVVRHGKQYPVMTNSPRFEQQIALNAYWKDIGGLTMLPGTNRASDRFARASYYAASMPKFKEERKAVGGAFSIIRNVSVPLGFKDPQKPNISTTLWRTVADHKALKYYYESAISPNIFWVDLKKVDFSEGNKPKQLDLDGHPTLAGEVSAKFKDAKAFKWLAPNSH